DLLSGSSSVFGIGPSVSWNVFDAGRVRSNITIQSVRQEQALIAYEQAVLRALHDVEGSIVALAQEQIRRDALERAAASSAQTVSIAEDRYAMGESDYLRVLEARLGMLSVQDEITRSDGRVASYTIRLYKALGGGWSALAPEAPSADASPVGIEEDR
ncbi:MAG: TolC family protein, partial [Phycisphaerales bacterium JB059]